MTEMLVYAGANVVGSDAHRQYTPLHLAAPRQRRRRRRRW